MVVDRAVGLVLAVCAVGAAVVGQAGCYRDACACKEDGLVAVGGWRGLQVGRGGCPKELRDGRGCAVDGSGRLGDDERRGEGAREGDSHQGFGHRRDMVVVTVEPPEEEEKASGRV